MHNIFSLVTMRRSIKRTRTCFINLFIEQIDDPICGEIILKYDFFTSFNTAEQIRCEYNNYLPMITREYLIITLNIFLREGEM